MMEKKAKRGGLGFVSVLTLIFIVLKLAGRIDWLWMWVLSPIWIAGLFFMLVFAIILIVGRIKKGQW